MSPAARSVLLNFLSETAPGAAQAYQAALSIAGFTDFPGRAQFLAHALRDFANRLPDAVLGEQTSRQDAVKILNELKKAWSAQNAPPRLGAVTPSSNSFDALLGSILTSWGTGQGTKRDLVERMFRAWLPAGHNSPELLAPIVESWMQIARWAQSQAHFDGTAARSTPWSDCEERLSLLEGLLSSTHAAFFEVAQELDAILEDANA